MTEEEWLECADPGLMEFAVGDHLTDRKLRLFGCACVRGVWDDLPSDALRQAVETCERFADNLATVEELKAARDLANGTYEGIGDIIADHSAIAVTALCEFKPWFPMGEGSAAGIAAVAAEARFDDSTSWDAAFGLAQQYHCELLRDVVGNPFRPVTLDPSSCTPTVIALAQAIYDHRRFDDLPVLADALEESGCTNADILNHLRSPGPHVKGCWPLDLLLRKS